jgi:hypothetical protein
MMVAVAAVALILATLMRQVHFKKLAEYHDCYIFEDSAVCIQGIAFRENYKGVTIFREQMYLLIPEGGSAEAVQRRMDLYRGRIQANQDWHKMMKQKHLHAAFLPWLPVEPDPPEPKLPAGP